MGGRNFGLGSSREHAPRIIRIAGVGAVLAQSFARIFFRNAINVGLPVLQCDTSGIGEQDELEVDLSAGEVRDLTTGAVIPAALPTAFWPRGSSPSCVRRWRTSRGCWSAKGRRWAT